jgi:hypothetical protein
MSAMTTTTRLIDLVAGTAAALCLGAALWIGTEATDSTNARIAESTRDRSEARRTLAAFRTAKNRQQLALASRRRQLTETGQLPDRAPIDEYFRALSTTAAEHHLHVVRHQPLSSREYPGLLEQRFTYEVTGTARDLLRFLRAIEESGYWADVGYLKMERGVGDERAAANNRVATLTISLFSSLPTPHTPKAQGT